MIFQISTRQVLGCTGNVHFHALNCKQTLLNLDLGVQTVSLQQYAPHHLSNVHKSQGCAVGVQAATMIYNHRADLVICVHTQCMPLRSI